MATFDINKIVMESIVNSELDDDNVGTVEEGFGDVMTTKAGERGIDAKEAAGSAVKKGREAVGGEAKKAGEAIKPDEEGLREKAGFGHPGVGTVKKAGEAAKSDKEGLREKAGSALKKTSEKAKETLGDNKAAAAAAGAIGAGLGGAALAKKLRNKRRQQQASS